jgi:hypothetical protein
MQIFKIISKNIGTVVNAYKNELTSYTWYLIVYDVNDRVNLNYFMIYNTNKIN